MENSSFGQAAMNRMRVLGALAVTGLVAAGCEDITNPVEEFGQLAGPYVRFEAASAIGTPDSYVLIIFQMPTRVEEDVEIDFSFGGDAVFGQDYIVVDDDGNPRTDVTASGGSVTIRYDFDQTAFARDTLRVFVPFDATDGAALEVEITAATTASGDPIETGFIDRFRTFTLSIEGFVAIPTGRYVGTIAGNLGAGAVALNITDDPVVIGGAEYRFVIDDYAAGAFGGAVPWAFNVTSGGTAIFAPEDAAGFGVTSEIEGEFDFATNNLTLDVLLTCCGGDGFVWSYDVTRQP